MSKSGRGNPPEDSRFKKGVSGNPKGRPPKRGKRQLVGEIVSEVQNAPTAYREGGRTKLASRLVLILKKLVNAALGGDPKSADDLFTKPSWIDFVFSCVRAGFLLAGLAREIGYPILYDKLLRPGAVIPLGLSA